MREKKVHTEIQIEKINKQNYLLYFLKKMNAKLDLVNMWAIALKSEIV